MKNSIVLLVSLVCLFSCFQLSAAMHKENMPMEGQLDQDGPRSSNPNQSVQVFLEEQCISVEFYKYIPNVIITIKDTNNNIIYAKTCSEPEVEIISLAGFDNGSYTLELRTQRGGYMYGTFLYGY